eukprot:2153114-Amphidinium_carterae.1
MEARKLSARCVNQHRLFSHGLVSYVLSCASVHWCNISARTGWGSTDASKVQRTALKLQQVGDPKDTTFIRNSIRTKQLYRREAHYLFKRRCAQVKGSYPIPFGLCGYSILLENSYNGNAPSNCLDLARFTKCVVMSAARFCDDD